MLSMERRYYAVCLSLLLVLISVTASAITPEEFVERYNSKVLQSDEMLDLSVFKLMSEEPAYDSWKGYLIEDVLFELAVLPDGNLRSFGVLARLNPNDQLTADKLKAFIKSTFHALEASDDDFKDPEVSLAFLFYDLGVAGLLESKLEIDDFSFEKEKNGIYYMFSVQDFLGITIPIFMCYFQGAPTL